ncbi:type II toxin-antitoxin system HicB family antitoxin [Aneurinibacillus tyrosinisolvens]|uniref:type II toxin-antitoxin system HicB family antitoxin n=1 Tax=Aneurinibacillus tyrosinisolvens TaxID=1443435 RepID=UPI00063FB20A|nr:type II toxin-antitoxin system HicB family antitoxin [Aneurinibacillus tyrosinisolvens]
MENKNIEYYMNLPYTLEFTKGIGEDNYFYVRVKELEGCASYGDTLREAYESIREAMEGWIEVKLEYGDPVPEPVDDDYSGKFNVRIPKSLHKHLTVMAEKEGVSLNQYVLYKLSR